MDKRVLKQVCQFLQTQKGNEAFFSSFWDKTKDFYPEGESKIKVKQWLKECPEHFEIIAGKDGNPFAKIRLVLPQTADGKRPSTTEDEDKEITAKLILIELVGEQEDAILFCTICSQKAEIFPPQLQDKKYIKIWLMEHKDQFEISLDQNGGIHSVGLSKKARKNRRKAIQKQQQATEHKAEQQSNNAKGKLVNFICEKGGSVPFADVLKQVGELLNIDNNDALFIWLANNGDLFDILPNANGISPYGMVKVKLGITPRFCHSYTKQNICVKSNCPHLHICKAFFCGQCHTPNMCGQSHDIRDEHNRTIINQSAVLRRCTNEAVCTVLLKSCFPRVCSEYNKNKLGECKRGAKCNFLHVCGDYVLNQCRSCDLLHIIACGEHNMELLKKYGLLPSAKMSLELIKTNIAYVAGKSFGVSMPDIETSHYKESKKEKRMPSHQKKGPDGMLPWSFDNTSSSCQDTVSCPINRSALTFGNIAGGNLNTFLTGEQKVRNWMSGGANDAHGSDLSSSVHSKSTSSSEGSVDSSVVSSHHSISLTELEKKVFMTILNKYDGSAPFQGISHESELFPAYFNVRKWFEDHPRSFILVMNGRGQVEQVRAFSRRCRICLDYSSKKGCFNDSCSYFHICKNLVQGHCPHGDTCRFNHEFKANQPKQLAKSFHLDEFTGDQLLRLVQLSTPSVCFFHNNGYCNRGVNCPNIHICEKFVKGKCPAHQQGCKFGHLKFLETEHAKKILERYQMAKQKPKYVQKMLFVFSQKQKQKADPQEANKSEVSMAADESKDEKNDPEICSKFLTGTKCKKTSCNDIHHSMPYLWQFNLKTNTSGKWRNFNENDCENIEKVFCDVNCTEAVLDITTKLTKERRTSQCSVRLDFQTMCGRLQPSSSGDGLEFQLRRLESNVNNTTGCGDWFEAQWLWYKLDSDSHKWVQYEINKISALEESYREGDIQVNQSSMRRRPVFISRSEVEDRKKVVQGQTSVSEPAEPVSETPLRQSIQLPAPSSPSDSHYRVKLEPGTQYYQVIERLVRGSAGHVEFEINKMEKINNQNLWEKFKSKAKQMHDDLLTSESVNERYLLMPCRHDDVERIMKDNVGVSRLDLPAVLGPGHYFTSNASLCLERCTESFMHSRFLLVCQVLVGTYTQGSPSTTEYPRREDGRFYNSLVNDIADPIVFVVPEVDQVYPAFIVDFSFTPMVGNTTTPDHSHGKIGSRVNHATQSHEPVQQRGLMQGAIGHPFSGPTVPSQNVSPAAPVGYPYTGVSTPPGTVTPQSAVRPVQENFEAPPPYSELPGAFGQPSRMPYFSTANQSLFQPALPGYPVSHSNNTMFQSAPVPHHGPVQDCAKLRPLMGQAAPIATTLPSRPAPPRPSYSRGNSRNAGRQPFRQRTPNQASRQIPGQPAREITGNRGDTECVVM